MEVGGWQSTLLPTEVEGRHGRCIPMVVTVYLPGRKVAYVIKLPTRYLLDWYRGKDSVLVSTVGSLAMQQWK